MSKRLTISVLSAAALITALCIGGVASRPVSAAAGGANPVGHLDGGQLVGARATLVGWTADPNTSAPIRIAIYRDGGSVATMLSTTRRDDVARAFPTFGAMHGFAATTIVPAGSHRLCVNAINIGPGVSTPLGCKVFTVPGSAVKAAPPAATRAPFGHVDSMLYWAGALRFAGWSIDSDSAVRTLVDVTVGGSRLASVAATVANQDVGREYPRFGAYHGFVATVAAPTVPGNYLGCVTAINTAAGPNTSLGCWMFTVAPAGVPDVLNVGVAADAATALQAQAVKTHAAAPADFPVGASSAARIAIATRALLEQATGRRPAPPAQAGIPKFTKVTTAQPVDEQAVMGPTPYLGNHAPHPGGRPGPAYAVQAFANDPLPTPHGDGDGLIGAAPVLPANGTTVHPRLPAYPAGTVRLRAEVALDAALTQLGVPYVFAAAGPDSFDCSGLTMWAWAKAGRDLYHYTGTQATQGVRVTANQLLPGDLVLFGSDIHHVGMYLGAGYMINAPYTGAYVRVNKISSTGDFSLAVRP